MRSLLSKVALLFSSLLLGAYAIYAEYEQVPGVVPSSYAVDNYGALNYTVPIEVPFGVNGMQPSLALQYNNRAGNGLFGLGWSLAGLSQITRGPGIYARQGFISGVNLDNTDHYYLDGQLLLRIPSTFSGYVEYRTEIESFAHIRAYGATEDDAIENPIYFEVATKSGHVHLYGNDAGSKLLIPFDAEPAERGLTWMISESTDLWGNRIDYVYKNIPDGQNVKVIDEIHYAYNVSNNPEFRVRFNYEPRGTEPLRTGIRSLPIVYSSRVSDVVVLDGSSEEISRYSLQYEGVEIAHEPLLFLKTVTQVRNGKALDPLVLSYDSGTIQRSGLSGEYKESSYPYDKRGQVYLPVSDIAGVRSARLSSVGNNLNLRANYDNDPPKLLVTDVHHKNSIRPYLALTGDVTGDGLSDVYYCSPVSMKRRLAPSVIDEGIYTWDVGVNVTIDNDEVAWIVQDSALVDVDGDGVSELIELRELQDGILGFVMFKVYIWRFVADGSSYKLDLLTSHDLSSTVISSASNLAKVIVADHNGDLLPDVYIKFYNSGKWSLVPLVISRGMNDVSLQLKAGDYDTNVQSQYPKHSKVFPFDWNADGESELILLEPATDQINITVLRWNGSGFVKLRTKSVVATGLNQEGFQTVTLLPTTQSDRSKLLLAWAWREDGLTRTVSGPPKINGSILVRDCNGSEFTLASGDGDLMMQLYEIGSYPADASRLYLESRLLAWDETVISSTVFKNSNWFIVPNSPLQSLVLIADGTLRIPYSGISYDKELSNASYVCTSGGFGIEHWNLSGTVNWTAINIFGRDLFFAPQHPVRMTGATSGTNLKATFSYTETFSDSLAQTGRALDLEMVSMTRESSGESLETVSLSYSYQDPVFNLQGRGFLGFKEISVNMPASGVKQTTEYYTQWPFHGIVEKQRHYSGEVLLSSVENEVTLDAVSTYGTWFPMIPRTVSSSWDLSGDFVGTTTTWRWYDNQATSGIGGADSERPPLVYDPNNLQGAISNGNITRILTEDSSGPFVRKDFEYSGLEQSFLGLPTRVTVKSSSSAGIKSRAFTLGYINGSIQSATRFPDSGDEDHKIELSVGFLPNGNPEDVWLMGRFGASQVGSDGLIPATGGFQYQEVRLVHADYSEATSWRFPDHVRNALGHSSSYEYDVWGRVTMETDPDGLQTSYEYDPFGRLAGASYPDDTQTLVTISALEEPMSVVSLTGLPTAVRQRAVDPRGRYKITISTTGQPDVEVSLDAWWREIERRVKSVQSEGEAAWAATNTVYDKQGRLLATALQRELGGSPIWNFVERDPIKRISRATSATGEQNHERTDDYFYAGLLTAVYEGVEDPGERGAILQTSADGLVAKVWNGQQLDFDSFKIQLSGGTTPAPSVIHEYGSLGEFLTATVGGNGVFKEILAAYDSAGNQESLSDPDTGVVEFRHDALGRLRWQKTAGGTFTRFEYDRLGRMTEHIAYRAAPDSNWSYWCDFYWYDGGTHGRKGALARKAYVERLNAQAPPDYNNVNPSEVQWQRGSYYDELGRPFLQVETIDDRWYYQYMNYDGLSRVERISYFWRPPGLELDMGQDPRLWHSYSLNYTYHSETGYLEEIRDSMNKVWWFCEDYDLYGRPLEILNGDGKTTTRTYDPIDGTISLIYTNGVQNFGYDFDKFGNLVYREDLIRGIDEVFAYDSLDRLIKVNGEERVNYDGMGRINWKRDAAGGTQNHYSYHSSRVNAVETAYGYTMGYDADGLMNSRTKAGETWSFGWAPSRKPWWIFKGQVGHEYGYTASGHKYRHVRVNGWDNDLDDWNRHTMTFYTGGMEQDFVRAHGATSWSVNATRIYIPGLDGVIGVCTIPATHTSGQPIRQWYYKDHLGSVTHITDETGAVVQEFSYDPWGAPRDPSTHQLLQSLPHSDHSGFTGHMRLDDIGLIDMGGRLYDPLLARTLSPDPLVVDPWDAQSYNRYSYVANRPLSAVDPSGYDYYFIHDSGMGTTMPIIDFLTGGPGADRPWGGGDPGNFFGGHAGSGFHPPIVNPGYSTSHNSSVSVSKAKTDGAVVATPPPSYGPVGNSATDLQAGLPALDWYPSPPADNIIYHDFRNVPRPVPLPALGAGSGAIFATAITTEVGVGAIAFTETLLMQERIELTGSPMPVTLQGPPLSSKWTRPTMMGSRDKGGLPRTHVIYQKTNPMTGQVYIGRASGYGTPQDVLSRRDARHHMNLKGYGPAQILDTITAKSRIAYPAIRGREQQWIDYYGGVGDPRVGNSIRAVSPKRDPGYYYWMMSNFTFGPLAPYTGE